MLIELNSSEVARIVSLRTRAVTMGFGRGALLCYWVFDCLLLSCLLFMNITSTA